MPNAVNDRAHHRRLALECGALVDLLNQLYSPTALPAPTATEAEMAAWFAERRLVDRLNTLRKEAIGSGSDVLQPVLGAL
jgi:hypothetical protein